MFVLFDSLCEVSTVLVLLCSAQKFHGGFKETLLMKTMASMVSSL